MELIFIKNSSVTAQKYLTEVLEEDFRTFMDDNASHTIQIIRLVRQNILQITY